MYRACIALFLFFSFFSFSFSVFSWVLARKKYSRKYDDEKGREKKGQTPYRAFDGRPEPKVRFQVGQLVFSLASPDISETSRGLAEKKKGTAPTDATAGANFWRTFGFPLVADCLASQTLVFLCGAFMKKDTLVMAIRLDRFAKHDFIDLLFKSVPILECIQGKKEEKTSSRCKRKEDRLSTLGTQKSNSSQGDLFHDAMQRVRPFFFFSFPQPGLVVATFRHRVTRGRDT